MGRVKEISDEARLSRNEDIAAILIYTPSQKMLKVQQPSSRAADFASQCKLQVLSFFLAAASVMAYQHLPKTLSPILLNLKLAITIQFLKFSQSCDFVILLLRLASVQNNLAKLFSRGLLKRKVRMLMPCGNSAKQAYPNHDRLSLVPTLPERVFPLRSPAVL